MRQTKSLPPISVFPMRRVFAGCRYSLLADGPSRRYLRHPCIGAWTPTPQHPFDAITRFFSKGFGLTLDSRGSACQITVAMQLQRRNYFEAAVIP